MRKRTPSSWVWSGLDRQAPNIHTNQSMHTDLCTQKYLDKYVDINRCCLNKKSGVAALQTMVHYVVQHIDKLHLVLNTVY